MTSDPIKSAIYLAKYSFGKWSAVPYLLTTLKNQRLPDVALETLNWERTHALLTYAYEKTRYYRRRFDEIGLKPEDVRSAADFNKVPVLTREDLRDYFEDLVSVDARSSNLNLVTTGGSTGQPVKVYHQRNVVRAAMLWRMQSWWNLGPGANFASVYRETADGLKVRFKSALLAWPAKRLLLDATALDERSIRRFIQSFKRLKPKLLHGYVGAVDHLATYILENSIALPSPIAVWVTSAPLTAVQEKRIQKAFGAPVYDQYGCCEVFYLAAECPSKQGLHMFWDVRRIEFLDDRNHSVPSGQFGDIAITDLENFHFPIIRYRVGDRGRALRARCNCGITLPLMDKVRGRVSDMIKLPGGKRISGDYLTTIFDATPDAVQQFRVHQKSDYSITILVVPNSSYAGLDSVLETVKETLHQKMDRAVVVRLERTNQIDQTGGKLRFVISEVA